VISGVSLSPQRRRCGLYFQVHTHNIRAAHACAFLRHLLRQLRGPIVVLWDNSHIHKGPVLRALLARHRRLRVAYLPPYAPELNPDEGVWRHAKADLANGRPDDLATLLTTVTASLVHLQHSATHLRACIAHAGLSIRLP